MTIERFSEAKMNVFYDEEMLNYQAPAGVFDSFPSEYLGKQIEQPEGPDRIFNTVSVLQKSPVSHLLNWHQPSRASDEQLLAFHTENYLDRLKEVDQLGDYLSASTYLRAGGMDIVRLSAGSAIDAARQVVSGKSQLAYAMSRPPSHHAQPDEADGYCFINGVGLAALKAISGGYKKVAVIDWDVHHGNGTQVGFYDRADVLTISMHMDHGSWGPSHLQTGREDEIGEGDGEGFNLNLPLPLGAGDYCYNEVFRRCVVPAVKNFQPDFIVLANGQDANQFDPNGRQGVTMAGFYGLACQLKKLIDEFCEGRLVMTQEGGYNPSYAPLCAYAIVAGLLGREMEIKDPIAFYPDDTDRAERDIEALVASHPLLS